MFSLIPQPVKWKASSTQHGLISLFLKESRVAGLPGEGCKHCLACRSPRSDLKPPTMGNLLFGSPELDYAQIPCVLHCLSPVRDTILPNQNIPPSLWCAFILCAPCCGIMVTVLAAHHNFTDSLREALGRHTRVLISLCFHFKDSLMFVSSVALVTLFFHVSTLSPWGFRPLLKVKNRVFAPCMILAHLAWRIFHSPVINTTNFSWVPMMLVVGPGGNTKMKYDWKVRRQSGESEGSSLFHKV